jgi:putative ABC transport system permease protein
MNMILKNFINTLKRFKLASFLNIAGLSVAFAAFLIIMIQVQHEWTFDKVHPDANRIFRVDMPRSLGYDVYGSVLTRGFANKVFTLSPHIEAAAILNVFTGGRIHITVEDNMSVKGFIENIVTCYPDIVNIFGFSLTEGDVNCLKDPEKALIPESMAKRMFGGESSVGKLLYLNRSIWTKAEFKSLTVGGVYKDFPENTQLNNDIYTAMDKSAEDDWYSQNFLGYVLLDRPESKKAVEDLVNKTIDFKSYGNPEETHLELVPLTDIYYMPGQLRDFVKIGNRGTTNLLFWVALFIIVIACINFVNFSTALAPLRMKSVNTQKVLGRSAGSLRAGLIFEAAGMSILAFFFSLLIVWGIGKTEMLSFVVADITISGHLPLVILLSVLSLVLGVISGLYPAWYMTSFPPALVLKGNFGLSASGRQFRTTLIGFQYIVSIGLIVCSLFIQLQNRYMRTYDLGFKKEGVAMIDIGSKIYVESKDLYTQKLKEYPGIEDVAFSSAPIGRSDAYSAYNMQYKEKNFNTYIIDVSWNFLDVMDIPVIEGKNFTEAEARNDSTSYYIYDKKTQEMFQLEAGDFLDRSRRGREYINGFVNGVKLTSLRLGEDHIAFKLNKHQPLPVSYVRLKTGADAHESVEYIRKTLAEIDPSLPVVVDFYENFFDHLYKKEEALNKMITIFSLLAIILSIVGVFGLVVFETQYRRKEIGIRKVFGATMGNILTMFNRIYIRIICICFVIAVPVAFYFVKVWLEGFYYHTPIHWWVFAVAFVVVMVITIFTVSFQNWRAANANPVESIKTE